MYCGGLQEAKRLISSPTPHSMIALSGIFGGTGVSKKSASDVFGIDELKEGTGRSAFMSAR